MKKEYLLIDKIEGSFITLNNLHHVSFGEVVELEIDGEFALGRVTKIEEKSAEIQIFKETTGISTTNTKVVFKGRPFEIPLSKDILGRVFNGIGDPIDKGVQIYADKFYNVNGRPMNPVSRKYPRNFIETGIRAIDSQMTLIRGQKLPIFSGSGLPHNELAA